MGRDRKSSGIAEASRDSGGILSEVGRAALDLLFTIYDDGLVVHLKI